MPTPTNRVPVRVGRGYLPTLTAAISDLYEGEVVYAVDEKALYIVEAQQLVPVAGTSVVSVNGQTGSVLVGVDDLQGVGLGSLVDGDMLVYTSGQWTNVPATSGGTVLSVDVNGTSDISVTGGPVTSSGVFDVSLTDTGAVAGQYTFPTLDVDTKGRITNIASNTAPAISFDDLVDVDASLPGIGDGISWNGLSWVSTSDLGGAASLDELTDVDVTATAPIAGQALIYNANSGVWAPGDVNTNSNNGTVEDLRDVSLTYPIANGDGLFYDEVQEKWVSAAPGSLRPYELQTYNTNTVSSPLIGGDSELANEAAWTALGFSLFDTVIDPLGNEQRRDLVLTSLGVDCAFDNAYPYGRKLPGDESSFRLSQNALVRVTPLSFAFFKDGVISQNIGLEPDGSNYDYLNDRTFDTSMEVSIFARKATVQQMYIHQVGVIPEHVDADGIKWTVFRRELRSYTSSLKTWATEIWVSDYGAVLVKQGAPSWPIQWGTQIADEHGVSIGFSDPTYARPPAGYGDGSWGNVPISGGYVAFCGPAQLPASINRIGGLDDVDTTGANVGDLLQWDGTSWLATASSQAGATTLGELSDVNVSNPVPAASQVLSYSEADSEWQAANPRATDGAPTGNYFPGLPGEMRFDQNFMYICIALNTWKKCSLSDVATPGPDEIVGGGDFTTGTSDGDVFLVSGGDFTAGTGGTNYDTIDGGIITEQVAANGGDFTTGAGGDIDEVVDGGDFSEQVAANGGDFTTGASGDIDETVDGGDFSEQVAANGGDFTTGASGGVDETVDGGDFSA